MATATWMLSFAFMLLGCVYACPPEQLIRPCTCNQNSMVCQRIIEQNILEGIFRRLGNTKLVEFILRDSRVDSIPVSILGANRVERIKIVDSAMGQLFKRDPPRNNDLVQISLENATLQNGLIFSHFRPLRKLEILLARDTEIPELGEQFSKNLQDSIRLVAFTNTKTRSIEMGFVGKYRLEDVRIQNTSLTTLSQVTFPYPNNNMLGMSFDGNQIEELPEDLFEYMKKLRRVSLAFNRISEVSEKVFGPVYDQLKFLILHGNPIKCDCSIKWLALRESTGKTVTGKCAVPARLAGKSIIDLEESDFSDC